MCFEKVSWYKLGAVFAGLYVACGIVLYALPGLSLVIADYLVHSTMQFTVKPFDAANFAIGTVLWFIIGGVIALILPALGGWLEEAKKAKSR